LREAFDWYVLIPIGDCLLWPACTSRGGYGQFRWNGQLLYAHIVSYELAHGPVPLGHQVDHIDCVSRACVEKTHLRAVTNKQNGENRTHLVSCNRSGFRGVSWHKHSGLWTARVSHLGRVHAAYFTSADAANTWAVAKRLELFTHNEQDRKSLLAGAK